MVDKRYLCKCDKCLKKHEAGVQVTIPTWRRHKEKQAEINEIMKRILQMQEEEEKVDQERKSDLMHNLLCHKYHGTN